jgi:3-hydroxyacyl-[acyl-carrier-protein] dehydratase
VAWSFEAARRPAAAQFVRAVRLPSGGAMAGRTLNANFTLSEHHPIALGHYPGHPIVPGSCLLEAALQTIEHAMAHDGHAGHVLKGVEALQLERPARPGEEVGVELRCSGPAPDGSYRWRAAFESAGYRLARATLVTGEPTVPADAEAPWCCGPEWETLSPLDVVRRLPHRAPMLLVDQAARAPDGLRLVAERNVTLADCCYADTAPHPATAGLAFPPLLVLESMAQAAGLLLLQHPPAGGAVLLLGGLRSFEVLGAAAPAESIRHELVLRRRFGDTALVGGTCFAAGRAIARLQDLLVVARFSEPDGPVASATTSQPEGATPHVT